MNLTSYVRQIYRLSTQYITGFMGEGYAKLSDILVTVQLWDSHGYLLLVSVLPDLSVSTQTVHLFSTNLMESTAILCIFTSSITRGELISLGNLFSLLPYYILPRASKKTRRSENETKA